ncbi:Aste57867_18185 [Aphanomyces stellatus]|uniref:Aste57867_18185 protein n=1 Tax=Aphanomyces stellatus TaxID=120398 RepID=A0A485L9E0_9STRA|nr:hypothetical protein As57867_018123 [Aphanomyces stellatus]VFT94923.1 Aste57867_18185 [Aphanomyces stellatus]
MGKKVFNSISPHFWTHEEHCRFLEALEKCGHCAPSSAVWTMIADYVGTRNFKDVKLHANRYFLQLQMVNTQKRKEMQAMQAVDSRWTLRDDKLFEELLATYSSCAYYPWEVIAAKFVNKSAKGVRDRYLKLLYDIAHIESGHHVTMHLKPWNAATTMDEKESDDGQEDAEFCMYDCSVTLTADEEDILMTALEEAQIPSMSSSNLLAVVASAVVAITNHSNKKPPTRKFNAFTKDEAARAIDKLLQSSATETPALLELLVSALHLQDEVPDAKSHQPPLLLPQNHQQHQLSMHSMQSMLSSRPPMMMPPPLDHTRASATPPPPSSFRSTMPEATYM